MNRTCIIRVAGPGDATGIASLFRRVYRGHYPAPEVRSASALRAHMKDPAETFFVAALNGRIVGCASTRILPATIDRGTGQHVAELGRLCTAPELPDRRDVARQICLRAIGHSGRRRARAWYVTLRSGPALCIAKSLGFVPTGYTEEHVVWRARERHIVAMRLSRTARRRRALPHGAGGALSVYRHDLVRKATTGLGLRRGTTTSYPRLSFVADPTLKSGRTAFQTVRSERRARLVGSEPLALSYLDAVVPTGRVRLIAGLRRRGWRLTAFLPGWYRLKYDCVLLSLTRERARAADRVILDRVRRLESVTVPEVSLV
jgi:hypothetical protein